MHLILTSGDACWTFLLGNNAPSWALPLLYFLPFSVTYISKSPNAIMGARFTISHTCQSKSPNAITTFMGAPFTASETCQSKSPQKSIGYCEGSLSYFNMGKGYSSPLSSMISWLFHIRRLTLLFLSSCQLNELASSRNDRIPESLQRWKRRAEVAWICQLLCINAFGLLVIATKPSRELA